MIVSAPLDPAVLTGLPDDMRRDAADSAAVAVRLIDGVPVSVCAVSDLTETLWDVGLDTVESARRQGHGAAVFRALAATMAAQGQQPVWAAYEDYVPSLAMAERLGFRLDDRFQGVGQRTVCPYRRPAGGKPDRPRCRRVERRWHKSGSPDVSVALESY